MCSNRWLLKNEGNPSFILKYLEKFKISTLIKKCPGFPGNTWQKEPAKKKRAQIQRTQICSLPPPNATNMEVNLRIVHFVNVENKKKYFFLRYGKRRGSIPSGSGLLFRAVRWHGFFGMGRLWFLWCHHPEPEAILSGLSCHAAWGVVSCVFSFVFLS